MNNANYSEPRRLDSHLPRNASFKNLSSRLEGAYTNGLPSYGRQARAEDAGSCSTGADVDCDMVNLSWNGQ